MQSAVVLQEIPLSVFTPAGGVSGDQDEPFVVVRMAAPGPVDLDATAKQLVEVTHEIAVKFMYGWWDRFGRPRSSSVGGPDDAGRTDSRVEIADRLTGRRTCARDRRHTSHIRWHGLTSPRRACVSGGDDDGTREDPETDGNALRGDTHEIPVKPMTLDGIAWEFQVRPMLAVCKTVLIPTAKQSEVVGHETEWSWLIPGGGDWLDQDNPPVVVAIIVDPAPALPLFPTAMQSLALAHEMLKRSTPLEGTSVWLVQVDPLLSVPITYGAESKLVPRATQFVTFGQKTPFSSVPKGIEVCAVQEVRFTVLTEAPPPAAPLPTATHVADPAHETEVRDDTEGGPTLSTYFHSWFPRRRERR